MERVNCLYRLVYRRLRDQAKEADVEPTPSPPVGMSVSTARQNRKDRKPAATAAYQESEQFKSTSELLLSMHKADVAITTLDPAPSPSVAFDKAGNLITVDKSEKASKQNNVFNPTLDRAKRRIVLRLSNIDTIVNTTGLPIRTTNITKTKKQNKFAFPRPLFTPDPKNPRTYWFRDGRVIGYPVDILNDLLKFKEYDWNRSRDVMEPSYNIKLQLVQRTQRTGMSATAIYQDIQGEYGALEEKLRLVRKYQAEYDE